MKRILAALGLAGFLAGCQLIGDLTTSNVNNLNSTNDHDQSGGPSASPSPTVPAGVTNFRCERVESTTGHASSCTLRWEGGGSFDAVALRASDGATQTFTLATSGTVADPGMPGAGAGDWVFSLMLHGAPIASTNVRLDS